MELDFIKISLGSILLVFIYFVWKAKDEDSIAQQAPTMLTSLGILFTFIGISIALVNFDVDNINNSIPLMLQGLKTAFFSSIAGLSTSILFKIYKHNLSSSGVKSDDELKASDFLSQMKDLNKNIIDGNKTLKDALVGDGDASLSTQIGKLRNDFRDFADKVAEDGSQKLIEALENVIKDFNQKITEQFGENFKQLNEAVGALLKWQEEYKNQVEVLTQAFKDAQKGIEATSGSLEKIEASTARIPDQMAAMEGIFEKTNTRVEELTSGLGSLAELRVKAEESLPEIHNQIDSIVGDLTKAVNEQLAGMKEYQEQQKEFSEEVGESLRESAKQTETLINQSIQEVNEKMGEQIGGALEVMGNQLTAITKELHRAYQSHYQEISKALKK
jgi:DNA anti-recombination protein RmuC